MRYILKNLDSKKIYEITGTTNLDAYIDDIRELFRMYIRKEILPEKYKELKDEI